MLFFLSLCACRLSSILSHFLGKSLLDGISPLEQVDRMCSVLGTPTEEDWPGFRDLENAKELVFPQQPKNLLRKFIPTLTDGNFSLLTRMFSFNPANRMTASQAKAHEYWQQDPLPDEHLLLDW
jgi:cell division cycle 2-like protein